MVKLGKPVSLFPNVTKKVCDRERGIERRPSDQTLFLQNKAEFGVFITGILYYPGIKK